MVRSRFRYQFSQRHTALIHYEVFQHIACRASAILQHNLQHLFHASLFLSNLVPLLQRPRSSSVSRALPQTLFQHRGGLRSVGRARQGQRKENTKQAGPESQLRPGLPTGPNQGGSGSGGGGGQTEGCCQADKPSWTTLPTSSATLWRPRAAPAAQDFCIPSAGSSARSGHSWPAAIGFIKVLKITVQ